MSFFSVLHFRSPFRVYEDMNELRVVYSANFLKIQLDHKKLESQNKDISRVHIWLKIIWEEGNI